jgi:NAD-dependent histone deacetylase SIR2
VYPFAALTQMVDASTPRVLFNLEEAGNIGAALNDVTVLDECDKGVRALCDKLGWTQELEEEWATTALPPKELHPEDSGTEPSEISGTNTAEDNVEKLAADLATTLNLDKANEKEATKDKEITADVSTSTNDEPLPTEPSQPKAQEEGKL